MLSIILKTSSNISDLIQTEPSEEVAIFSMIAGIILTTLGVTGNLLTIIALLRNSKLLDQPITRFVISLAVSDFIFSAFNIPTYAYAMNNISFYTKTSCQFLGYFYLVNASVSIYNLVMITVSHYILICHNSKYNEVSSYFLKKSEIQIGRGREKMHGRIGWAIPVPKRKEKCPVFGHK